MGHTSPTLRRSRGRLLEHTRPVLPTPGAKGLTVGERERASVRRASLADRPCRCPRSNRSSRHRLEHHAPDHVDQLRNIVGA
eukprot:16446397-Heterocapsa_arctica.AAC.1